MAHRYGDKRVLCVGSPGSPAVAREYGFTRVATVADVIAEDPRRYPLHEHKFGDNHGAARASSSLDGHDDEFAAVRAQGWGRTQSPCGCGGADRRQMTTPAGLHR